MSLGLKVINALDRAIFHHRAVVLALFALATIAMGYYASQLRMEAGFEKMLPQKHEFMGPFFEYQRDFGGANRVLVAVMQKDGDILNPEFFQSLRRVHDSLFVLEGVYRPSVKSLYSPDVRYVEIVEGGFSGEQVVPPDFTPTPEMFERVRNNIIKAELVGQMVSKDFRGALVTADLLPINVETGEPLDYQAVSAKLEDIRQQITAENPNVSVHIIGFAKSVGDIAEGARSVITFFAVTLVITFILLFLYSRSIWLSLLPLLCTLVAVVWQLGLLKVTGIGMDPMNILVPFLIVAIGVSHGVQMINGWNKETLFGASGEEVVHGDLSRVGGVDSLTAARLTFRRLLVPGSVALVTDAIGFVTLLLMQVTIIQQMALTASIGVAIVLLTNLILLPTLLSYVRIRNLDQYRAKHLAAVGKRDGIWRLLAKTATWPTAAVIVVISLGLGIYGYVQGNNIAIGDLDPGVSELWPEARYNQDAYLITDRFGVGVDVLTVFARSKPSGCVDYEVMRDIDFFISRAKSLPGVLSVNSLSELAKKSWVGYNEGNPKWYALPRDTGSLTQTSAFVEVTSGLLNFDCSVIPIYIYLSDHRADTIRQVVSGLLSYVAENPSEEVDFLFAGGNVGVIGATNDVVAAAQFPIVLWVYAAVIFLCLLTYRTIRGTLCIVLPLALVSMLAYALMVAMGIGLKVNTLPVVALGVGVGVDYGIYIFSQMQGLLKQGESLHDAYFDTLKVTGKPVMFTAVTLAAGVSTWIFSDLKFQADMGILLTFMFVVNMLGAIIVLPALARVMNLDRKWIWGGKPIAKPANQPAE